MAGSQLLNVAALDRWRGRAHPCRPCLGARHYWRSARATDALMATHGELYAECHNTWPSQRARPGSSCALAGQRKAPYRLVRRLSGPGEGMALRQIVASTAVLGDRERPCVEHSVNERTGVNDAQTHIAREL